MAFAPEGTVTGTDGCNQYSGSFHTDGTSIEVSQLATRRCMGCEPPRWPRRRPSGRPCGATEWRLTETSELELRGHGDLLATPADADRADRHGRAGDLGASVVAARRPRRLGGSTAEACRRWRSPTTARSAGSPAATPTAARSRPTARTIDIGPLGRDGDGLPGARLRHRVDLPAGARRRRSLGDPAQRPARPDRAAGPHVRAWLTDATRPRPRASRPGGQPVADRRGAGRRGSRLARPGARASSAGRGRHPASSTTRVLHRQPLTTLDDHLARPGCGSPRWPTSSTASAPARRG